MKVPAVFKSRRFWIAVIVAVLIVTLGKVVLGQPNARMEGLVIKRGPAPDNEITCKFLYRVAGGARRIEASDFCAANITEVKALGRAAIQWARDNPVVDPAIKRRFDSHKAELEAAGYTVTDP